MVEKPQTPHWWPDFFEPFRNVGNQVAEWFQPRSDAKAADSAYHINLELPGVKQDDIEIELHQGVMTVKGEKKFERTEEKEGYFFSERQYGKFQRTFRLPADASEEGVTASFSDGVLSIAVPKEMPQAPQSKKIEIGKA